MKVQPAVPKKLQRLPDVFAKVLQLPFPSDTDISVQETSECFLFTASADDTGENVRVHAVEIYPGATKVAIKGMNSGDLLLDEVEIDLWRFRLPAASTLPEMATARCCAGQLVVTVPKTPTLEVTEEERRNRELY
ncbi:Heat shock 22 kDa protein [Melia azedarach]|uniref:Heat shock 22 kDa protein n=1 Tax=Melia azedarach TaxID=155640 RepID=A0ACC1YUG7_MELAZ|nr:Heat shock 22 kDa protein [Melia azedarach]